MNVIVLQNVQAWKISNYFEMKKLDDMPTDN